MKAAVAASFTSQRVATTPRDPAARKEPVSEESARPSSPGPRAVRQAASTVRSERSSSRAIRKLTWLASLDHFADPTGRVESRESKGSFAVDLQNGDVWSHEVSNLYDVPRQAFALGGGAVVTAGTYTNSEYRSIYTLAPHHRASGTLTGANVTPVATQQIGPNELNEVIAMIRAGAAYANVHTAPSPGGEIRGQLKVGGDKD